MTDKPASEYRAERDEALDLLSQVRDLVRFPHSEQSNQWHKRMRALLRKVGR